MFQRIRKAKRQSRNFVVDISNAKLDKETIDKQIKKIFLNNNTAFVDTLIIVKNGAIEKIIKRT